MNKKSYVVVMFVLALAFFAVVTGGCGGGSSSYDGAVQDFYDIGEPPVAPEEPFVEVEEIEPENPDFWISRLENPDEVILDEEQISFYNEMVKKSVEMMNLEEISEIAPVKFDTLPDYFGVYIDGAPVDQEGLIAQFDANRRHFPEVLYGIIINHTDVRFWPVSEPVSLFDDMQEDAFQIGTLEVNEPVLVSEIYQASDNECWYYITSAELCGWVLRQNVALFHSMEEWKKVTKVEKFVVVTEPIMLEDCYLAMGTKVTLADPNFETKQSDLLVHLPSVDSEGFYRERGEFLSTKSISIGHLPFTQRNVIKLAFAYLGYWVTENGEFYSLTNGDLVNQVYACFGIKLPVFPIAHARIDAFTHLSDIEDADVQSIIEGLPAGTILYSAYGNAMIYLGNIEGEAFCIGGLTKLESMEPDNTDIYSVVVFPMHMPAYYEKSWYDFIIGFLAF